MKNLRLTIVAVMMALLSQSQSVEKKEISTKDYRFAMSAAKTGLMQLKLGELAVLKGTSENVKKIGSEMVKRHQEFTKEVRLLTNERSVFVAGELDAKQQRSYEKLSEKSGADFDRSYLKHMRNGHENVISDFEKEIKYGDDAELISWATATLPILELYAETSPDEPLEVLTN